jgi:hypothetical protein
MATLSIKQRALALPRTLALPALPDALKQYNKYSILSLALAALFILYFIIPHSVLYPLLSFNVFYILIVPAAALVLSVIAIRQIYGTQEKGIVLSYIALGITTLYFMVALAIPLVLIGLYLLYSFVL